MTMSNVEAGHIFEKGFGVAGIAEEEAYMDPLRGIDKRVDMGKKMEGALQKAPSASSTSGGTYTGYGMLPPFLDPSIVDRTVRETPLVRLLPRRAVRGRSYVYNIITAKAGAAFLPEDAALSEQVDTRSTGTGTMRFLYAVGRVTGVATASQTIINIMAEDLRVKTASMNEALEDTIINGDNGTSPNEFDGFIQLITTNTTNNAAANITLAQMRTDINTSFEANGLVDLIVTDGYTLNYVKGLLMDYQRHIAPVPAEFNFGIPDAFMFDGIMVLKDRYMPATATSRRMLFLDTRYIFLAVLQDYTYEELAKTNDSQKYMIKWYGTLIMTFEASSVMRFGLA